MKNIYKFQEILLSPRAHFLQRDYMLRDEKAGRINLSEQEKFLQLCWNGMLNEMMPEIIVKDADNKPLTIWEVNESPNLVEVKAGKLNFAFEDSYALQPATFLRNMCEN